MSSHKIDILVEIPNENLPQLALLYRKIDWAPHIFTLIKTGIFWKQSNCKKYSDCITFLSIGETYTENGTIVVILKTCNSYSIFVSTLNEDYTKLRDALISTELIDYKNENAFFACIYEKHIPLINQVVADLNLKVSKSHIPFLMYALSPEKKYSKINSPPQGVIVEKLNTGLVKQINQAWPHNFKGSQDYIASLIEINGGYGIFLEETNELVAWILRYNLGHVGILQTKGKYKGKGYGTYVTKVMADHIIKEGIWPCATIAATNFASIKLFEKLGFENRGEFVYFNILGVKKDNFK